jgi:hypothetical protein
VFLVVWVACRAADDSDPVGTVETDVAIDRGPTEIPIDGYPNGAWWDVASGTLFVADDRNDRVLSWSDADGLGVVGALPAPARVGLGGVILSEGKVYVARFGDGTLGDVAWVGLDGSSGVVAGLDPTRRRLGLTVSDGLVYDTWFFKSGQDQVGGISALSDGEQDVAGGVQKPVGIVVDGQTVLVSDDKKGQILAGKLGDSLGVLASIDSPQTLTPGPGGSVLTFARHGRVWQIDPSGATNLLYTPEAESDATASSRRGISYDAVNRRLFLSHHDVSGDGALLIVPIDSP